MIYVIVTPEDEGYTIHAAFSDKEKANIALTTGFTRSETIEEVELDPVVGSSCIFRKSQPPLGLFLQTIFDPVESELPRKVVRDGGRLDTSRGSYQCGS